MDAIRSLKGYGKVNDSGDHGLRRRTIKRLALTAAAAAILVTGVVVVVASKHGHRARSSSPSAISESIRAMCGVTRYPDTCYSSVSSAAKGRADLTDDPEELFQLSLAVAAGALSEMSALVDTLTAPRSDRRLEAALRDCKELFGDAIDRVNDSLASLQEAPPPGEKAVLTRSRVDDLRSWLSAAVADQETCLDGFEGTTGDVKAGMEVAMVNSTRFTSNSLAIAAGLLGVMGKLDFPVHRRLLATADGLPVWASGGQRRAILRGGAGRLTPNVTVAKDGSGQVRTIQEAVDLAPEKSESPFVIYVREGVYEEKVAVGRSKWNVVVVGDGMYKTVVDGSLNFVDGTPTFSTATFVAAGRRFMARDMGFKNSAGPQKHQAVALRVSSDRSVFYRCSFDAFQCTLNVHSLRQFYRECDITGTIDFIYGDASAVFQDCKIRPRQPLPNHQDTITAQGKADPNENTGISIQGCTITPYDKLTAPVYLGRPWKDYSTTIVMQSEIGAAVQPAGWLPWVIGTVPPETINYAEYNNTGPGSNVVGRVKWAGYKPTIGAQEAKKYTVDEFIQGSDWIPETSVEFSPTL